MQKIKVFPRILICLFLMLFGMSFSLPVYSLTLDKKQYKIYIVVDILKVKFQEVVDGIRFSLDEQLKAVDAAATYTVFDTNTDPARVPSILESIKNGKPDLIFAVNSPDVFADRNISLNLKGSEYRIVSENCIPVQSGVAQKWEKPSGNITGVGVFVQMTSLLKLAKMIRPESKKLVFISWEKMTVLNDWLVQELTRACLLEGIEFSEVRYTASAEDDFEFYLEYDKKGPEYFGVGGVSAWVHRDGSFADMNVLGTEFLQKNIKHFPLYAFEDTVVKNGSPAGACVIWYDLGAQMAEKGMKILAGDNPGDLSWEYPRKYNIMLNLKAAQTLGIVFPPSLIQAAYRVYTDYQGNYLGQKN